MRHGRKSKRHARNVRRKGKRRNQHHIVARANGGSNHKSNILLIDVFIHREYHKVFGNRSLEQTIALLQRVKRAKNAQRFSIAS